MEDRVPVIGSVTRIGAFVCAAIVCAGCSPAFTGRVDFHAPPGWIHSNDPTAGETWIKPDGSNQSIMAQTTNSALPPHEPGWKDITICGNHPAVLMFQKNDPGQLWEAVSTNWNSHRYMAVYVRPISASPDPAAETAIRTICLKRT
jgi:hypothetical protein